MKKLKKIAISCHYDSFENKYKQYGPSVLVRDYFQYPVLNAGGCPFILPSIPFTNEVLDTLLEGVDGVVIYGGFDIDPSFYNEEITASVHRYDLRDSNEITLVRYCVQKNIPLLGTCRGMQIINVALGGSLYQDIKQQFPNKLTSIHELERDDHNKLAHHIQIELDSIIYEATGSQSFMVNSFHHQAIKHLGENLSIIGTSNDGVIEAIQCTTGPIYGVQRHPEFNYHCNSESQKIIDYFVQSICKGI